MKYNEELVRIQAGKTVLEGELVIPQEATGLIIFSYATGRNGYGLRNKMVSQVFNKEGFATLQVDLLNKNEEKNEDNDVLGDLLTSRLTVVTRWAQRYSETRKLHLGYFGTAAGATAALNAAVDLAQDVITTVVCRGAEFIMNNNSFDKLAVPVLFIVGEKDTEGVKANKAVLNLLTSPKELKIISGASHYFNELGKLGEVAYLAAQWYKKYLPKKEKTPAEA